MLLNIKTEIKLFYVICNYGHILIVFKKIQRIHNYGHILIINLFRSYYTQIIHTLCNNGQKNIVKLPLVIFFSLVFHYHYLIKVYWESDNVPVNSFSTENR